MLFRSVWGDPIPIAPASQAAILELRITNRKPLLAAHPCHQSARPPAARVVARPKARCAPIWPQRNARSNRPPRASPGQAGACPDWIGESPGAAATIPLRRKNARQLGRTRAAVSRRRPITPRTALRPPRLALRVKGLAMPAPSPAPGDSENPPANPGDARHAPLPAKREILVRNYRQALRPLTAAHLSKPSPRTRTS